MKSSELIKELSDKYLLDTKLPFGKQRSNILVSKDLKSSIASLCGIDENKYKVYGSVGTGNWAEIPWLAILDKEISTSTRKGYYVVLLFDKEIKNLYICLSAGWVQFEEEYGTKDGITQINALCKHYAKLLDKSNTSFAKGNVPLNAKNKLGKGYEAGSILYKKCHIRDLDEAELKNNLDEIMHLYQELRDLVGDSILNIEVDADNYDDQINNYKKKIARSTFFPISDETIKKLMLEAEKNPPEIIEKLLKQIPRNRKYSLYIKQKANFVCSICNRKPFLQKNGQPYAEADHVNPLGLKGDDNPVNMRCLCAQCHAIITYGSDEEKRNLMHDSL